MARKRQPNGKGTVYQRKDGRWEGAAYFETLSGDRHRVSVYGRSWDEANDKLTEALANARKGLPTATTTLSVGQYLAYWLEHVARPKVRPSTYASYETYIRLYITPGLGRKKLKKLSAKDIRTWLSSVRKTCTCCANGHDAKRPSEHRDPSKRQRCCAIGKCCKRYPSARTVKHLHALLRTALQQAVREDLIVRNVAKNVQFGSVENPEITPLTVAEAKQLLQAAEGDRLHAVWAVALGIGLRRGEALGLRWEDVDLTHGRLTVRQTLQRTRAGLEFVPPKTHRSRRSVELPSRLVSVLREHRLRQSEEMDEAGDDWREHGLVFCTRFGTPIEPRNLNRSFTALCKRAKLRDVRLHDLRHTCATLLLAQGVDARTIMEILGHSAINVTMNVYAHVLPERQREALDKLGDALDAPDDDGPPGTSSAAD
ncbi:tyrosine-type recombinase/integrase [Nocardiopsis baichengensis]|uniref:tyrosine-type recombinase/integrase n=1 Tax=Nocardiopsis baichengensis TaxID=280240 RepID=UPI000349629E|nr:site-specific integrase [Nocardiopsis baichengensis]